MSIKRILSLSIVILLLSGCATTHLAKDEINKAYSHFTLGLLYDNENNFQQAIKEYEQALIYDAASPSIHLRLGIDYALEKEYDKAIQQFQLALEVNPKKTYPRFLLALLWTFQKKLEQASQQYKQIIELEPDNFIALIGLSDIYVSQEKFTLIIPIYEKMLEIEKQTSRQGVYYFYIGVIYDKMGQREKSVENFKKAVALNPNNAGACNYLGYMFAEQGINLDEAEELIKKAIEIEPEQGAYADSLGWVYYKKALKLNGQQAKQMLEKALKEINRAIELMGDDPIVCEHYEEIKKKIKELNIQ